MLLQHLGAGPEPAPALAVGVDDGIQSRQPRVPSAPMISSTAFALRSVSTRIIRSSSETVPNFAPGRSDAGRAAVDPNGHRAYDARGEKAPMPSRTPNTSAGHRW